MPGLRLRVFHVWPRDPGDRRSRHVRRPVLFVMAMMWMMVAFAACAPSPVALPTVAPPTVAPPTETPQPQRTSMPPATPELTRGADVAPQKTATRPPAATSTPVPSTAPPLVSTETATTVAVEEDVKVTPSPTPELAVAPQVGALAPAFTLFGLDDSTVSLEDLRGQYVILNFWATWCGPCRAEMPELQAIAEGYAGDGVVVLAIDYLETENEVTRFVEEHGLTFAVGLDSDGAVTRRYLVRSIPTSLVIDGNGVVVARFQGPVTADALAQHTVSS